MLATLARLLTVFLLISITSCAGTTPPSRFYLLTPLADSGLTGTKADFPRDIAIGIGPVSFPEYLNRPQIVSRADDNELHLAEFHRWAESLSQNFTRVLAENLATLLGIDHIAVYPWKHSDVLNYRIKLDVVRLEGSPGGETFLKARWSILNGNGKKMFIVKTSQLHEATDGRGHDALVAAESRLLESLSREIAMSRNEIHQGNSSQQR